MELNEITMTNRDMIRAFRLAQYDYEPIKDSSFENGISEQFWENDNWIKQISSTEDNENFSEEYKLFQKVIASNYLNKITIKNIFINIQLTGY